MTKQQISKRILYNGKPIPLSDFTYDPTTKTISTSKSHLVFNFSGLIGFNFITGSDCNFITGSDCNFITGSDCVFNTGSKCTFNTNSFCTFDTGSHCNFDTGSNCTFNTISDCIFKTDSRCTFNTGSSCTFDTTSTCTFKTVSNCVCIRRDVYEVIEIPEGKTIKLNSVGIKGYAIIDNPTIEITVKINGKESSLNDISEETLLKLRNIK